MLNDKGIAVAGPAKGMGWDRVWGSAARGVKVRPKGAAAHWRERGLHDIGTRRVRPCSLRLVLARSVLAAAMASSLPLHGAAAQEAPMVDAARHLDLPAGELAAALGALGTQGGVRIDYQPELVSDRRVRAVSGHMGWQDALDRLLQGTGLKYRQTGVATAVIEAAGEGAVSSGPPARAAPETSALQAAATATELAQVTVTGTRIRGGTTPSPVIVIGSENIREEGFTDLGEVIRSVPQNFTGGQNPGVLMGNVTGGGNHNQNVTGGAGLNLRGLGPDATLTLLNGRRLSYGGSAQAVDISAIPVEAVERVEIVADGASAIYGSDAVGGVGNVVLKRDFEGLTLGARYGAAGNGGLTTREYTGTAGTAWGNGGLIATYKTTSVDPIYARQRGYTNHLPEPTTIYPGSDLRSSLITVRQSLGDLAELSLDVLRTRREQLYYFYFDSAAIFNELTPRTETAFISPGIELMLPNDWTLSIGGGWGKDEYNNFTQRAPAETGIPVPSLHSCFCNKSRTYEVGAEGPLFEMGGSRARLALGAGSRNNDFHWRSYTHNAVWGSGDEASRFAYAEMNLPLIGPFPSSRGAERLAVTAALRSEDYDSYGTVTTPKVGAIYRPSADFTLKSSWGKSYKVPTLFQRFYVSVAEVRLPLSLGGTGHAPNETAVLRVGGNPDVKPERAESWSASIALHPQSLHGLEAELSWFYIDYNDRVIQPITNYSEALTSPIYAEFVELSPAPGRVAEVVASADLLSNLTGMPFDPGAVVAIVNGHYVNATRQRIKGLDLSGSYRFDLGQGQMTLRGSFSWLDSTQQTVGTPGAYELAGMVHNPARSNSRLGAVWNQGGFSAATFANYTGGLRNRSDGVMGASFTTLDTTLRYDAGERSDAWTGVSVVLAANNLLDRSPPLYAPNVPAFVAPYDSTNYPAIGRFISLSVSKHW